MICPKCQTKLQDGEAVCPTCGLCRTDMPIVQANHPTPKKKTGVLLTVLAFLSPLALTEGVMAAILDIGRRVVIALRTDAFGSGNFELGNTLGIAGTILSQVTHFVFFLAVGLTVPSLILSIIAKIKKRTGLFGRWSDPSSPPPFAGLWEACISLKPFSSLWMASCMALSDSESL